MRKIIKWIVTHQKFMLILYGIIIVASIVMTQGVTTNYNMVDYLPEEMGSKIAIDILSEEYGNNGTANILLENLSVQEILAIKSEISKVRGVDSILWLDDVVDIKQPLASFNEKIVKSYYAEGFAYLQVLFIEDDYSQVTNDAIEVIQSIIGNDGSMSGPAITAKNMASSLFNDMKTAMFIVIPIVILLLILSTHSYFEIVLFLITIGIAILINNGTNLIFGEISFITASASSLLQLAIAMDYSIFLLHRFGEERKKTTDMKKAMIISVTKSFSTITASAATTVIGFLALTFMSFKIGMDLGLVLAKGIVISLVCVITLLPVLTIFSVKLIEKTSHKEFLPSFHGLAKVFQKGRFLVLIIAILIAIPAFLGQQNNSFVYGSENAQSSEEIKETQKIITDIFGGKNAVLVMVPNNNPVTEYTLINDLARINTIDQIQGLYSYIDPTIPDILIPNTLKDQFISENYSRYILNLSTPVENNEAFETHEDIDNIIASYYEEYYITGATPSTYDTMVVSEKDYKIVALVSILAVGVVLVITFKSLVIPILLLLGIEISIWLNMSIPYFTGNEMIYLGFLIVSALQLGATIDYAILLTNRYMNNRKIMPKEEATIEAVSKAGHSIFTSCTILGTCGLSIGFLFDQITISSMGMLIGRGALISGFVVLLLLPQILLICDPLIQKTTINHGFLKS